MIGAALQIGLAFVNAHGQLARDGNLTALAKDARQAIGAFAPLGHVNPYGRLVLAVAGGNADAELAIFGTALGGFVFSIAACVACKSEDKHVSSLSAGHIGHVVGNSRIELADEPFRFGE